MGFELEVSDEAESDLAVLFDFITESALNFGEDAPEAIRRARARLAAVEDAMDRLAAHPHQGTLRPDLGPGLRHITKERAIFYFHLDEKARTLRILAVFFGGQDRHRRMMLRMLGG